MNPLTDDAGADDRDAMLRLRDGDKAALESLYDRHAGLLFSLALRVTGRRELAEEIVHDVFITVWTKPWMYDPSRGTVSSWLCASTRNRAIDRIRSERPTDELGNDPIDDLPIEQGLVDAERAQAVRGALREVPPRQREVIEYMYFRGLGQEAIAARLDIPLGTVKSRAFHGMRRLRELLEVRGVMT